MRFHAFAVAMVWSCVVLGGCAASDDDAAGNAASDLHAGSTVTPKAMADEIKGQDWLASDDECTWEAKAKDGGFVMTLTADKGTVSLDVPANAKIARTEKDDDGSVVTFDIEGVGRIQITDADDAFVSFALTSDKTHKTTTCEEDF
jgi:hypothetical protein